MLSVYFNATPLLLPKTGIRQYTISLLRELRYIENISAHYFYFSHWSDELVSSEASFGGSRLWKLKNIVRDYVPFFLEMQHRTRGRIFRRGVNVASNAVYHEPNFLPFKTVLPTIITVHDLSVLRFPETHPAARVKFMAARLSDAVATASYVITDSEFVRQEVIAEFGVPSNKVIAIHLAASAEFSPPPMKHIESVVTRHGLPNKRYLLVVGTLEPRKNLVTALRAYSELPSSVRSEFSLVLAGLWGWQNDDLKDLIYPLIASGEVKVLGYVADQDMPALYAGATAFVYPSLYEGFGLPPLEAMACGAPVIVSNSSSLPEVVGDAGLQVEALDVNALSQAMLRVIEDDNLRVMLGRKGVERATNFSWQRCALETAAIYRKASA